jgi:MFS superfamily sulfate permease-like transporter
MTQTSGKVWATLGWISVFLVAASIPYAIIDGVMGIFILYAAIIVGGLSGFGVGSTAKFGVAVIVFSLLIANVGTHYATSTGLRPIQFELVFNAVLLFAMPILIALVFLVVGIIRRRTIVDRQP